MNAAQRMAQQLNAHHLKTCAGFYGVGGGRFFQARVMGDVLEVSPDFGATWIRPATEQFRDHNGRAINLTPTRVK